MNWIKVCIMLIIIGLLSWYGKIYKPPPSIARVHDFAVWIMPHKNGLGALVVAPNDNIDTNNAKTGLRIWISPPDSILAFEKNNSKYRGKNIIIIGDSLNYNLKQDMLSTLDSNGNLYWLSGLSEKNTGEDVSARLKLFNNSFNDYILELVYEGYKIKFFGSQLALDSAETEPLSAAVLMFKPLNYLNLKNNSSVQSLIWKGKSDGSDSSRIALDYPEAYALISYNKNKGLFVKRMSLKNWQPDF